MTTVTRDFKMHPKLLRDVIKRQAGTLDKAIVEGVMNAIEANSTKVEVEIDECQVRIKDNGQGFPTLNEIEKYFEVFGAPHTEEEDKIWANFRMGRGQMFSFGKNAWRTASFTLHVDIDNKGLNYDIEEHTERYDGCLIVIDLYNRLPSYEVQYITSRLHTNLKYAPVPVLVNGKNITKDPKDEDWDAETDEAYMRLDSTNQLTVYNLGIRVCDTYAGIMGAGGVVVSKKQLQVNFARNDIQSTCPVWQKVTEKLNQVIGETLGNKKSFTDAEIERVGTLLRTNQYVNPKLLNAPLIMAVTGRKYSLMQIYNAVKRNKYAQISCDKHNSRTGDMVHRSGLAFVISINALNLFGATSVKNLFKIWGENENFRRYAATLEDYVKDFKDVAGGYSEEFKDVARSKISKKCAAWLEVATTFISELYRLNSKTYRKVSCGQSAIALAWTDGVSYIKYDEKFLNDLPMSLAGYTRLLTVTAHELTHETQDLSSHDHDQEFYENFHDLCVSEEFSQAFAKAWAYLPKALRKEGAARTTADRLEKGNESRGLVPQDN
jgi:hypothetical protein